MEKNYNNGEITVNWKPDLCIHSAKCWKSLPRVFNPRAKPWINMAGGTTDAIRTTVMNCPSGALSLAETAETPKQTNAITSAVEVAVLPNGPLLVNGAIAVKNEAGELVTKTDKTFFVAAVHQPTSLIAMAVTTKLNFEAESEMRYF